MIGSAVEAYDFFIYGTAAAAYFGTVFFHTSKPIIGVLAAFATLAVGFLMRPVGGYLAGHYGDRIGRKPILVWSLMLMGVATILIGFLPTYAQVGVIAPILLILLRMIQGIGFGAEWGGAVLLTFEHAPKERRGFFGAVPQIGIPAGLLMASGSFLLSNRLFDGDLVWRMPFIASIVMVAIGTWIRLGVNESPEFEEVKVSGQVLKRPALEVLRHDWRTILKIVGLRMAETGGYYITTSFLLSYVVLASITDKSNVLLGTVVGATIGLVDLLFFGSLSDRIGRKPVFLIGSVFTILFGIPMFLIINTGSVIMIIVAVAIALVFSHDPIFAVESSWFSEHFPANQRASGISLGYNLAGVVAGLLPFLATLLYGWLGWIAPALIFISLGVVSTASSVFTAETAPAKLRKAGALSESHEPPEPALR